MTGEKVNYCAISLFTVGNDHQFKKLVIVTHILLVISIGNVKGTVWRISILILLDLI